MLIRPSKKTFGLEGSQEIREDNIIILNNLYEMGIISEKVFHKMMSMILNDDTERNH